jgi:hypothetical protein
MDMTEESLDVMPLMEVLSDAFTQDQASEYIQV